MHAVGLQKTPRLNRGKGATPTHSEPTSAALDRVDHVAVVLRVAL